MIDFDQFVEYVTVGPTPHFVSLGNHALESVYTVRTAANGYIHAKDLGRAFLAGEAELALLFVEWNPPPDLDVATAATLKAWTAKAIAAVYVIATKAVLDVIQAERTVALPIIRLSMVLENGPLSPMEPFTSAQVTALSTWLNAHSITNTEFAALFDVTAAQLSTWLQNHPRWQFAQQIHERFE